MVVNMLLHRGKRNGGSPPFLAKGMYISAFCYLFIILILAVPGKVLSQTSDSLQNSLKLKKLSLEELMDIEVTSISMRPEKLTEVASAVQVISSEDIERSAASRLPEVLRLASNLQVAQANSHDWAITARGFNGLPSAGGIVANKLLAMMDGRSIYIPLFGGVYWDVQNVLLEDVDRIEVVSGPGGTLWGANAVNGVINIVTKSARETQGIYVSAGGGSLLQDFVQARYGFRIDSSVFIRVYGQRIDQKQLLLANGKGNSDAWNMTQGGFRMDYSLSQAKHLTVQGDFYMGDANASVRHSLTNGQNVLARYTHAFSDKSDLRVQAYFDRSWRKTPNSAVPFFYRFGTYDLDVQHRFSLGRRQSILWGGRYSFQQDETAVTLVPLGREMPLYSGFVQDEITCVPGVLKLTIGSKFLHNVFSGFEYQPSARLALNMGERHTLWTSVSRAVRTPSRFDSDVIITPVKFDSEKVLAYELGYRVRPLDRLLISLATFYNHYTDLRSIDSNATPPPAIVLANNQEAESWGLEVSGNFQATEWWRLRGGFTFLDKNIYSTSSRVIPISVEFESVDPKTQFLLQSVMDLKKNIRFDLVSRFVDALPLTIRTPAVRAYVTFDLRLAWQFRFLEISLAGQNLLEDKHTEAGLAEIPRSIYGRITCRF